MNMFTRLFAAGAIAAVSFSSVAPLAASAHGVRHPVRYHKTGAQLQTGSMEQVNESGFGDAANTAVRLYKMQNDLYAVTDNANGIQLWSANEDGSAWTQVTDSALTTNTPATSVVGFARYPHVVFTAVATPDGFEVWRKNRTEDWEKVYEQKGQETSAVSFGRFNKRVYVSVTSNSTEGQGQVWLSSGAGTDWTQFSTTGFDNAVNAVDNIVEYKGDTYVSTDDGRILQKEGDVWSVVYEDAEGYGNVTVLRKVHRKTLVAAVEGPNGAEIITSTDGTTWNTVVANGMENVNNSSVQKFMVVGRTIYALVNNSVEGAEIWTTSLSDLSTWSAFETGGLGDAQNTVIHFAVRRKGKTFYSTTNATDGGQIIRAQRS